MNVRESVHPSLWVLARAVLRVAGTIARGATMGPLCLFTCKLNHESSLPQQCNDAYGPLRQYTIPNIHRCSAALDTWYVGNWIQSHIE